MRWEQVQGVLERVLMGIALYAAGRGWISENAAMQIVAVALLIGQALWGAWINRDKALVQAAAATPGTTVVTTPALAAATPEQENIMSAAAVKVVSK